MASQKFSAAQREALWEAHDKKCAYTRELLDVSNFHIDHVIPENLVNNPVDFEKFKAELGLTDDFDPFGFENLLPCRPGANQQKGGLPLDLAWTQFFLSMASRKKTVVEANLEKIEKRNSRGKALILLQGCLERGELTILEVENILEDYGEQPDEIFHLIERMHFADATEVQAVAKTDIADLRNRPIRLGKNDHIDGVTLTNDAKDEVYVRTCKEYDEAINAGYYALTNFDIKMSAFFEHQCGLLKSLQAATNPTESFISKPKVGIVDLNLLPFSLFPFLGDAPPGATATDTYQDKVTDGTIVIKRLRQNTLCVEEPEGMGQQLVEVARADFNGDGLEDILVFEYCYATHGTLGFGGIQVLTRRTADGLFEVVSA